MYVSGTNILDITGQRFGRLTVVGFSHKVAKNKYWLCACDCTGEIKAYGYANLKTGSSKSCGCLQKERASAASKQHGMSKHPMYLSWQHAKNRCFNPKDKHFGHYGGRGIIVCDEWKSSFEAFRRDMSPSWKEGLELERINVDGNYSKENCRWATRSEQLRNTRRSLRVETPWGSMVIADLADKLGISRVTLQRRYHAGLRGEDLIRKENYSKFNRYPKVGG